MTTMENKEDILKKLGSEDIELRQEALAAVKNEGDITIVPALLDILTTAKDHKTTELVNLLADIKDNAFPQIVIDRIRTTTEAIPKSRLLRLCWESALDFSPYIVLFAELTLQEDFTVALEASTAIENIHRIDEEKRKEAIRILKQGSPNEEKQFLIDNALHFLTNYTEED